MEREIKMPKLGESVLEGTVIKWLKEPGENVRMDEPIAEVETDKVTTDIPSPVAGDIKELTVQEGDTVQVGEVICTIEVETETLEKKEPSQREPEDNEVRETKKETKVDKEYLERKEDRKHLYSPAVRELAIEHDIDPATLEGTGVGGRVTKQDMLKAIENRGETGDSKQALRTIFGEDEIVPLSHMRRTIAQRMVQSKQTAPHAWTMVEVDLTNLVQLREKYKDEFRRREGVNLTYLPFVIKAGVESLKEYPIMNSMWQEDRIVIRSQINIGVAVDLEDGLIVPVIKDADQKSIAGIAKAVADIASRARSGDLKPEEVQDGTFTINNTGTFGSMLSAPIINHPQAAILSMETIAKRPVVINDAIAIRSMINLCVSLDHRILDGAVCGRFLRTVKTKLESVDPNAIL